VIRIVGIGWENYWKDGWNAFDLIVAVGSLVSILVATNTTFQIRGTSILRLFRVLRLLRLMKRGGRFLNTIFNTFVITLQTLANIGGLLLLFIYMYAYVGVIYFGEVKRNGNMTDYINFETFISAFITLFTVATADTWNLTLASFTTTRAPWYDCIKDPSYE